MLGVGGACGAAPRAQAANTTAQMCAPMTLLATLCVDMPSMGGCRTYNALCNATAGSVVQQCKDFPAIPK